MSGITTISMVVAQAIDLLSRMDELDDKDRDCLAHNNFDLWKLHEGLHYFLDHGDETTISAALCVYEPGMTYAAKGAQNATRRMAEKATVARIAKWERDHGPVEERT